MRLLLDSPLAVDPDSFDIPKTVDTSFSLHCVAGATRVDVLYSLPPDLVVWFEVAGARTKTVWKRDVEVAATATSVEARLKLVWGPGSAFPAGSQVLLRATAQETHQEEVLHTSHRVTITNSPPVTETLAVPKAGKGKGVVMLSLPAPASKPRSHRRGKGK